jgi:hypothetical protein
MARPLPHQLDQGTAMPESHLLSDHQQRPRYNPARGGHAPSHFREGFAETVEESRPVDATTIGRLWNCIDIMPSELCECLGLRPRQHLRHGGSLLPLQPGAMIA